ncbi:MAG: hypothetical protein AABZ34_15620 [Nitrospirota bacterium]
MRKTKLVSVISAIIFVAFITAFNYGGCGGGGGGSSGSSGAPAPATWAQFAGGYAHTLARKTDNSAQPPVGTLWAWGRNNYGQLGDGTTVNKSAPVQIAGTTWAQVAGGYGHTLARKTDNSAQPPVGTLWAWGRNDFGQLGDGTTVAKSTPTQVGQ